jgi:hypothetical protein
MTKYIQKKLVEIIKLDSKKIKQKRNDIRLTVIMNKLSSFFGFRNFNELKKINENEKNYFSSKFTQLENLNDSQLGELTNNYINYINKKLIPNFKETYEIITFLKTNIYNINITKSMENGIRNESENESLKIDLTIIKPIFKINEIEKKELEYFCKKENINLYNYYHFFSSDNGLSLFDIKNLNQLVIFYYKKDDNDLKIFLNLLIILIKNHINKNLIMEENIDKSSVGCQIIQNCESSKKLEIITKLFDKNLPLGAKIGVFQFKDLNYKNEKIRKYDSTKDVKTCIRYCDPDILIFNNPDLIEHRVTIHNLVQCGYKVIIFTDTNYNHFNMIEDNESYFYVSDFLETYNTYNRNNRAIKLIF